MDSLQGSSLPGSNSTIQNGTLGDGQQGTSSQAVTNTINPNSILNTGQLSVTPNCTQSCTLGVSTTVPSTPKPNGLSTGSIFMMFAVVAAAAIGIFAYKVLNT